MPRSGAGQRVCLCSPPSSSPAAAAAAARAHRASHQAPPPRALPASRARRRPGSPRTTVATPTATTTAAPATATGTSRRDADAAARRGRRRDTAVSADGERSLHAGLPMTRDAAEERVLAGLEVDGERLRAACERGCRADLLAAGVLDRHVVGQRGRVGEVDSGLAGLGGEVALGELELTAGVGRVADRAARA